MTQHPSKSLRRALAIAVAVLIVRVTAEVILGYRNYFPLNFESDFLQGRKRYFFGEYQWAFYPHIAAGPVTLLLGLLLVSDKFRASFPLWHRRLGRVQVACVLFVVAPSGFAMAYRTSTGTVAAVGFALLAVVTGTCAVLGWRSAVKQRFHEHRRWMSRCYVLLCSAVVLRLFGGLGTLLEVRSLWFDPVASWTSWLLPLAVYEFARSFPSSAWGRRHGSSASRAERDSGFVPRVDE